MEKKKIAKVVEDSTPYIFLGSYKNTMTFQIPRQRKYLSISKNEGNLYTVYLGFNIFNPNRSIKGLRELRKTINEIGGIC